MSSADLATLAYVKETAFGVTPATPAFKYVRYTGESIKLNITNTQSDELNPNRSQTDLIQTGQTVDGGFNFELSYDTFKDILEGVFCGVWTTTTGDQKILKNGSAKTSFTFQKHFPDMGVPQFHNVTGACIESLDLKLELGKIISGTFNIMGADLDQTDTQITGATFSGAGSNKPLNAVTDLTTFMIDDVPYSGCIETLGINLKNNTRAIQCLGHLGATDMKLGTLEVTGDMNLYFNDGTIFDKFVSGAEFSFGFDLTDDAGNKYSFSIPRAKFESSEVLAGGKNSDVMVNCKWRGLYDSTSTSVVSITSDPV